MTSWRIVSLSGVALVVGLGVLIEFYEDVWSSLFGAYPGQSADGSGQVRIFDVKTSRLLSKGPLPMMSMAGDVSEADDEIGIGVKALVFDKKTQKASVEEDG